MYLSTLKKNEYLTSTYTWYIFGVLGVLGQPCMAVVQCFHSLFCDQGIVRACLYCHRICLLLSRDNMVLCVYLFCKGDVVVLSVGVYQNCVKYVLGKEGIIGSELGQGLTNVMGISSEIQS